MATYPIAEQLIEREIVECETRLQQLRGELAKLRDSAEKITPFRVRAKLIEDGEPLSTAEAIEKVLGESAEPLSVSEITERASALRTRGTVGEALVRSTLHRGGAWTKHGHGRGVKWGKAQEVPG